MDNLQIKPYSQHPTSLNKSSLDYSNFEGLEERLKDFSTDSFQVISRLQRKEILSREKEYSVCYSLPFWSIINERGDVSPCHIFYSNSNFIYGNIYKNLFSDIWESKKKRDVLEEIYSRGTDKCARLGCRGDSINQFLSSIKKKQTKIENIWPTKNEAPPPHINFI